MDKEVEDVIFGWTFLYIGLIGLGFSVFLGVTLGIIGYGVWILIGIYVLVNAFLTYQWPNRHEYMDFWRSQWTR